MEADGTFTASSTRPKSNLVTLEATNTATGEKATATVELVISWPEGWPYLSDEVIPWDEPVRSWAGRVLYDVLSSLPAELVREMGPVPIRRVKELGPNMGAQYYYHLTADFIDVPEGVTLARYLDLAPDASEFYGAPSALTEFVARRDPDRSWEDRTVDGVERTFFYKEPKDLAALVSLKAPPGFAHASFRARASRASASRWIRSGTGWAAARRAGGQAVEAPLGTRLPK